MVAMARRGAEPRMRARPHLQSSIGANTGSVPLARVRLHTLGGLAGVVLPGQRVHGQRSAADLQGVRNDFVRESQAGFGSKAALLKFMRRLVREIARPQSIA